MDDHFQELKAQREASLIKLYTDGKPLNADQKAELRAMGIKVGDEAAEETKKAVEIGSLAELMTRRPRTQKALAGILQSIYGERITITINDSAVSDWILGKDRLKGSPAPPCAKDNNEFIVSEWVEWFDRYMLAKHIRRDGETGRDYSQEERRARALSAVHREEMDRIDLLRMKERMVEKAFLEQVLLALGQWISAEHANHGPVLIEAAGKLRELQAPETVASPLLQWLEGRLAQYNTDWLAAAKGQLAQMAADADTRAKALAEATKV